MTKYFHVFLLLLIFQSLAQNLLAQNICSITQDIVAKAKDYHDQGFYTESLKLIGEIDLNLSRQCLTREYYELKVKILIAENQSSILIDSLMKEMIKSDPTFDEINSINYSQVFYNRFKSFNVYPNVQVGLGASINQISIRSKGEMNPVFYSDNVEDFSQISPSPFIITGLNLFTTVYLNNSLAGKLELTQNLPAVYNIYYNLDELNSVKIRESMYSRAYSLSILYKLGFLSESNTYSKIKNLGVEFGYQMFDIYQSRSNYTFFTENENQGFNTRYTNEVNTEPFRENVVNNLTLGVFYAPNKIINNKRIVLIASLKYTIGLSDYNKVEKRLENLVSTQLYYYAEDRFRIESLQFQLQLGYNVHYHKKKRK